MRQWVLSVPFALRYLFATHPAVMGQVMGIVYRAISSHLIKAAGYEPGEPEWFIFEQLGKVDAGADAIKLRGYPLSERF